MFLSNHVDVDWKPSLPVVVNSTLVASKHALDEVAEGAPEVLATGKIMLIDEQHVVFEAGIEMWFKP